MEKLIDKDFPPKKEFGKIIFRNSVSCVLTNNKGEVALLYWKENPWVSFIGGGIESGESLKEAAVREVFEETGYIDVKIKKVFDTSFSCLSSADHKKENRMAVLKVVHLELNSNDFQKVEISEKQKHEMKWTPREDVYNEITGIETKKVFEIFSKNLNL